MPSASVAILRWYRSTSSRKASRSPSRARWTSSPSLGPTARSLYQTGSDHGYSGAKPFSAMYVGPIRPRVHIDPERHAQRPDALHHLLDQAHGPGHLRIWGLQDQLVVHLQE